LTANHHGNYDDDRMLMLSLKVQDWKLTEMKAANKNERKTVSHGF